MIYNNDIQSLKDLQTSRAQYSDFGVLEHAIATDEDFRQNIRNLAKKFIKQDIGNCNSCILDAYVLLQNVKIQDAMAQQATQFELAAGVVLCSGAPQDKWMTHTNCTDALAIYWLKKDPDCIKYFNKVPDNLEELLAPKAAAAPAKETEQAPAKEAEQEPAKETNKKNSKKK